MARMMNEQSTELSVHVQEAEVTARGREGEIECEGGRNYHSFEIEVSTKYDHNDPDGGLRHYGGNTSIKFFNLSPAQSREIARQLKLQANRVESRERRNLANNNGYLNRYNPENGTLVAS
jgi:hypothetical protein